MRRTPCGISRQRRRTRRQTSSGRVGAFLSELSFQLFGYAAYLLPALIGVIGWHYFWCQTPDAAYTKLTGVTLLFACASALLSSGVRTCESPPTTRSMPGDRLARRSRGSLSSYFNRTGSLIVLAHTDDDVGHPLDAVLVRPHVRRCERPDRATCPRAAWAASAAGSTIGARRRRVARSSRSTRRKRPAAAPEKPGARAHPHPERASNRRGTHGETRSAAPESPQSSRGKRPDVAPPLPLPEPEPVKAAPSPSRRATRCRRLRCSTRRRASGRLTSESSWMRRGSSKRSAVSSRWKAR